MALLKSLMLSAAKTAAGQIIKSIDPAERFRIRFDASVEEADRELDGIFRAVITALFADATGRLPTSEEVENVLAAAADGPARVYRLIGESRKTTSRTRRQMLAAVLFGLQHSDLPIDHRDRVDILVERLMPEDLKLLGELARVEQLSPRHPIEGEPAHWRGLTLVYDGNLTHAIASRQFRTGGLSWEDFSRLSLLAAEIPLSSLETMGCIVRQQSTLTGTVNVGSMSYRNEGLDIGPLGRTLLKAFEDIRPGLETNTGPVKGK